MGLFSARHFASDVAAAIRFASRIWRSNVDQSAEPMRVVVYPDLGNPYQELLHSHVAAEGSESVRLLLIPPMGPRRLVWAMMRERARGSKIFHLHWQDIRLQVRGRHSLRLSFVTSWVVFGLVLPLLRFRLIWTVHNALPHEAATTNDKAITRLLARRARITIVHSAETIDELRSAGASSQRTVVIPHGSFITRYGASEDQRAARDRLGISTGDRTILFLGYVRPYKGVENLVETWKKLPADCVAGARLVIVGECHPDILRVKLAAATEGVASIDFRPGFVSEEDVPRYLSAADVACVPVERSTTSGSGLLALGAGKPLIAPRLGSLQEVPQNCGFLYENADQLGPSLELALRSPASDLHMRGLAALAYAADMQQWDEIARLTIRAYIDCLVVLR